MSIRLPNWTPLDSAGELSCLSTTVRSATAVEGKIRMQMDCQGSESKNRMAFPEVLKAINSSILADAALLVEIVLHLNDEINTHEEIPRGILKATDLSRQDWLKTQTGNPCINVIMDHILSGQKPTVP